MATRRILQLGDPLLRTISAPVSNPAGASAVVRDLRDTLHEFQRTHGFGRGISAVQIGEPVRLVYIEFEGTPYTIGNPEYEFQSAGKFRLWDDCFSFPTCWYTWNAATVCAYAIWMRPARNGILKLRARWPNYSNTRSTTWTAFWLSTAPWIPTAFAPAQSI